jgi:hypothetical protein
LKAANFPWQILAYVLVRNVTVRVSSSSMAALVARASGASFATIALPFLPFSLNARSQEYPLCPLRSGVVVKIVAVTS